MSAISILAHYWGRQRKLQNYHPQPNLGILCTPAMFRNGRHCNENDRDSRARGDTGNSLHPL